jgi:hypothetical protein
VMKKCEWKWHCHSKSVVNFRIMTDFPTSLLRSTSVIPFSASTFGDLPVCPAFATKKHSYLSRRKSSITRFLCFALKFQNFFWIAEEGNHCYANNSRTWTYSSHQIMSHIEFQRE